MSHFYGSLHGNRGAATRCGTKDSGLTTHAASWEGDVRCDLHYDSESDRDYVEIAFEPWHGQGRSFKLYLGPINPTDDELAAGIVRPEKC